MRWLIFLLSSVPFIVPFRWYPDGDFFSDALAVFFVLVFVLCSRQMRSSRLVLIGFLFSGLVVFWGLLGGAPYLEIWLAPAIMICLGALFLGCLQARQLDERSLDRKAALYGLVFGGGCSLIIALGQIFAWRWVEPLVFDGATGIVANIGQRNQFSLYIAIGVVAYLLLLARSGLQLWRGVALVLIMAFLCSFVLVHAGSRAVVLMVFSALIIVLLRLCFWRSDRFGYYFLIFAAVFFLVQLFSVLLPDFFYLFENRSGLERIHDTHVDVRWGEWAKAWEGFLAHPLGIGFGNYASFSFSAGEGQALVWSNPHNFILHFLVEMGFSGVGLIFLALLLVVKYCFYYLRSREGDAGVPCVLAFFMLHNLLEYSFWYANFFYLFLIFLAFLPSGGGVRRFVGGRLVAGVFLGLLSLSVFQYSQLLSAIWLAADKSPVMRIVVSAQVGLNPLLSWRADKVLMDFVTYDNGPDWEFKFCKLEAMAMREPLPQYLERMAFLAMVNDDHDLAGGILKARYRVLDYEPGAYFESLVRQYWPVAADDVIGEFKENKKEGFSSYEEYELGKSGICGSL